MNLKKLCKRAKSVLAFILAITLFFGGWANYDFSVLAEGEQLTVTLSATKAVYTGENLKPSIESVKDGEDPVTYKDSDVTWSDANGNTISGEIKDVGVYTVTVSVTENVLDADGNPTGETKVRSGSKEFTVKKLNLSEYTVNVAGSYTYTGTAIVPEKSNVSVTYGDGAPVDQSLYEISSTSVNAGPAEVVVKPAAGNANVTGEATGTFTINPVVFDIVWNTKDYIYDGSTNHFPTATVNGVAVEKCKEAVEITNGITVTLTTSVDTTIALGNYKATLTLNDNSGNYKLADGKATCTYSVSQKKLTDDDVEVTLSQDSATANGTNYASEVTVTVTVDGNVLNEGTDYEVSKPADMTTNGTYDIKVTGIGNYEGEVIKQFVIDFANDANAKAEVKGNTFKNNVYKGEITVIAPGYQISTSETGTYADELKYDVTSTLPAKLYLKNSSNGASKGEISEVDFPIAKLTFDNADPTLTVTAPDATVWASSKTVDVKSDGTGSACNVYYVKGEKVELTSPINKDTDLGELEELSGNLVIEENISAPTSYYFYAIDDAGNVVISDEIVVDKVDVGKPETKVDPSNSLKDKKDANGSYWKDASDFVIPIEVTDNLSGISTITVTGTAVLDCPVAADKLSASGTVTIKEPGTYTISVTDEAGLSAVEQTFVVEADTKAPEITLDAVNLSGTNKYHDTTANVYWFSDNKVSLPFTVADEPGETPNETLSTYKVVYSTDADFANTTEVAVTNNVGTAAIEIAEAEKVITYYFKTVDFAGNEGEVQSIKLGHDNSPAKISDLELTQLNGDEWINAAEFNGESKVAFSVAIDEAQSGVKSIEYSADGGKTYTKANYTVTNGVYTFVTEKAYPDGIDYQWKIIVTNNVNTTSDDAIAAGYGKIDTTAPSREAYIQFFTDTVGSNDLSAGNVDENDRWTSKILEVLKNEWNRIWGKTTVRFEVYVMDKSSNDVASGIAGPGAVSMTYGDDKKIELTNVSGVQAFDAERSAELQENGYSIFTGSITIGENETLSVSDFEIKSITDIAGNITENIILKGAQEGDIIYLDSVAPKLVSITYTDANDKVVNAELEDGNKKFYKDTVYAVFEIEERFFGEDGKYPTISVNGADPIEIKTWKVKKDKQTGKVTHTGKYELNCEVDQDIEYSYEFSYTDPSGNGLVAMEGVENGVYSSDVIAIDKCAPKLTAYEFAKTTECELDEGTPLKNNAEDDLSVRFTINDNAAYHALTGGVVVKVYNSNGLVKEFAEADCDLESAGNNHTYSFTYDTEDDTEDVYYVTIEYVDELDLLLTGEDILACVDGVYTSANYIIDHVKPGFEVELPEAVNVVKANGEVVDSAAPQKGDTAYYGDSFTVSYTFADKYADYADSALVHHEFELHEIKKDGEVLVTDAEPVVVDNKDETYTVSYTVDKEELEDGNYQFVVRYRDCSENLMNTDAVKASNETTEAGVYKSPILVLDTTAPVVTTEYKKADTKAEPARTLTKDGNEYDYFNNLETEFVITVDDRNIRYKELKDIYTEDVLAGIAKNVDGTPIPNTVLSEDIEKIAAATIQCVTGDVEKNIWELRLGIATEGNYTIPVNFTDLAGHAAVVNGTEGTYTEYVTADINQTDDETQIFIDFESDVLAANSDKEAVYDDVESTDSKWYSKIVKFISTEWDRIWGNKTINFKVYARDDISGIFELEISYEGDYGKEDTEITKVVFSTKPEGEEIKLEEDGTIKLSVGDSVTKAEDNAGTIYYVYSGSFTIKESEDFAISKFQITSLEDNATNVIKASFDNIPDNELIYLDSTKPKLTGVETDNKAKDSLENKFFYQAAENVQLTIQERFFGMAEYGLNYPNVIVKSRNYVDSNNQAEFNVNESLNKNAWKSLKDNYEWELEQKVNLPIIEDQEIEYVLEMYYQDPSGNKLELSSEYDKTNSETNTVDENGNFTSAVYVVDTLAPKLKSFVITGADEEQPLFRDNEIDYAKNIEGADVHITVEIDDNAEYFNKDNVKLYYITDAADANWVEIKNPIAVEKNTEDTRTWTIVYEFDGVEDDGFTAENEFAYRFKVVYADRATNAMVNDGAAATGENGVFISEQKVVIDHSAPKMTAMEFTTPVQMFDGETNADDGDVVKAVKDKDTRVYYDANAEISFDVDDKYLKASDMMIKVYDRTDKLVDFIQEPTKVAVSNAFKFTMPDEDAEYYFTISYTDRAGNQMVYSTDDSGNVNVKEKVNEAYDQGVTDGIYTSPIIIRDTIAPKYTVTYTDSNKKSVAKGTNNSVNSITAVVNLTEMNLNMDETQITVTATDVKGNPIECNEVKNYNGLWSELAATEKEASRGKDNKLDQRSLTMTFKTEANYTVKIDVVDKVTKKVTHTYSFCIDRTAPTIEIVDNNGKHPNEVVKGALVDMDKSDITYTVINDGVFSQILNKVTFGYFADAKIRVQIKAHDRISGVKNIVYTYTDVSGASKTITATPKLFEGDKSCSVYTFDLPISFKGQIRAFGIDNTGNSAEKTPSGQIGVIAETEDKHDATADVDIEVVSSYSKTPDYFNGDVKIKFTSIDSYSGLHMIKYTAGNDLVEDEVYYKEEGVEIVTSTVERNYTINASSNNENNIITALMLEDNAGYEKEVPEGELPKIHIDTTAPKVEVEYDNNDFLNEKYYKADRIATVTVTERNFDPSDVEFLITGPTASIGTWAHTAGSGCTAGSDPSDTHHSDSCRWSCTVHFSLDGDYTFGFRCVDLAGNAGEYDRVDEFTIDKTFPEITVVYDNNDFKNEYYYKEARTATITIDEHNFSPNDVIITMTAKDDGRTIAVPSVSGWSSAGDSHSATIRYNYDAEFTFDIEFMDLAGNEADDYEEDHFVVDMTKPELEIFDIEDMSANNGVVRPGIRYYDTNYDKDGTEIVMTGYNNGVVEMKGDRKLEANGLELKLDDFAYVQEMDDMYTMKAVVYDLAGNSSEDTVMFSVNRFGSVYTFDKATEALVGKEGSYYTKEAQDLVITETNVDTLTFKEITMNMNGKLTTLKEGADYTIKASGSDATWKQYTYTINDTNFTDEGTYIVTVYSEDRATNTSDNNSKGKKVEFVIDKTSPSVLISGIETNGQYRTNVQNMTIDIDDNVVVSNVKVIVDGVETIFDGAQVAEADGKIVVGVNAKNYAQNIEVTVTDAAGNAVTEQLANVRVNANVFVLFYLNKPLFFGTLGGGALTAGLLWWFLVGKKKKDEEQAQTK